MEKIIDTDDLQNICPECGSIDVEHTDFEVDHDSYMIYVEHACNACGASWVDVYKSVYSYTQVFTDEKALDKTEGLW